MKTQSESANASLSITGQMYSQGTATWDPEPWASHMKAWLERTSTLGEEGELPRGTYSLTSLYKARFQLPKLLGLLGAEHFPTAFPMSSTPTVNHILCLWASHFWELPMLETYSFSFPLPLAFKLL